MKDYYYILGVEQNCSIEEIKRAYKKLSQKFHPDTNDGDSFFADRFMEINEAYITLSDKIKRENYDTSISKKNSFFNSPINTFLPIIISFAAIQNEFDCEMEIQINWETVNADLVTIDPFDIVVSGSGSKKFKLKHFKEAQLDLEMNARNTYTNKCDTKKISVDIKSYEELNKLYNRNNLSNHHNQTNYHTSTSLIPFRIGSNWGFSTPDKILVIKNIYEEAFPFREGLASVKKNGKWGYIDEFGKEIIKCRFQKVYPFSEGLGGVEINGLLGFVDKTGTVIIPCKFAGEKEFKDGFAGVRKYNIYERILRNLHILPKNNFIRWLFYSNQNRPLYGFINKTGQIAYSLKYWSVSNFNEGMALIQDYFGYGFINWRGAPIIPPQYCKATSFSEGVSGVKKYEKSDSKLTVTMYIDKLGNEKLNCDYETLFSFKDGLAKVEIIDKLSKSKYGYINKSGLEVINCIFDSAESFSEGLAVVSIKDNHSLIKFGYIDKKGITQIPFKYGNSHNFHNGLARVSYNGKDGYITKQGDEYWEG